MIIRARGIGERFETKLGELEVEDMKLYKNAGGPFIRYLLKDAMQALVRDMKDRVARHYDNFVVFVGGEGCGKSNGAWEVVHEFDPDNDPSVHLIYEIKELRQHLREDPSAGQIFWLDELYEMVNNRSWNDPDTKWFINLLVRGRSRGWTFVCCIPRMKDTDEYIRNHRFTHIITCEPQEFDHSQWLERGYAGIEKKTAHGLQHVGYMRYHEMPPEAAALYEAAKNRSQDEMLTAPEKENPNTYRMKFEAQTAKLAAAVKMLKDAGFSRADICSRLGLTEPTYYRLCREGKNIDIEVIDDDDS